MTEDIQQDETFEPSLFSIAVDPYAKNLNSKFKIWYSDIATIAGAEEA